MSRGGEPSDKRTQCSQSKYADRAVALSGNKCAFPDCEAPMWDQGSVLGEICHIHGRRPGSARYIAQLSPTFVHGLDNLVLLCGSHHKLVDDQEDTYTADWLRQRKVEHEARVGPTPASMLSRLVEILSPNVPENWEDRPGAPVFRLGLASNRPKQPGANWTFQINVEQIDGTTSVASNGERCMAAMQLTGRKHDCNNRGTGTAPTTSQSHLAVISLSSNCASGGVEGNAL